MQSLLLIARDSGDTILGDGHNVLAVEDSVQHGCVEFTCVPTNAPLEDEHDNQEVITNQQKY